MSLEDLYKEVILDHYRTPRNKGRLDPHDVALERNNPLCGDEIELFLKYDGETLEGIAFDGKGCSISQASASMMTEKVKGMSVKDASELAETIKSATTSSSGRLASSSCVQSALRSGSTSATSTKIIARSTGLLP